MSHKLTFFLASLTLILGLAFTMVPAQAQDLSLSVVFNEVANRSTAYAQHEWIELLIKDGNPDFENWKVTAVTDAGTETTIFELPKLDSANYGDILLITASDPTGFGDHPLVGGFNVAMSADDQPRGIDHTVRYYVADWMNELPNGEFVLVLRNDTGIVDLAGYHSGLSLPNYPAPDKSNNALAVDSVRYRQHTDIIGIGTKGGNNGDKVAFREQFWTGIGYKRNAQAIDANGGTPGYPNDAVRPSVDVYGNVVIGEIMYASGDSNLPQWIELKNMSETVDVDIRHWKLWVTNHSETADGGAYAGELEHEIELDGTILAGQAFLIVASSGMNVARLPSSRVHNVDVGASETLLNPHGFELYLEANTYEADHKYHLRVDVANNMDLSAGRSQISVMPTLWDWPEGHDADGNRVSVVRVSGSDGPIDGESQEAWELYNMSDQMGMIEDLSYYGHNSDVSSPGLYPGSAMISNNDDAYGNVIISEIMYATGKSNLSQWIELKNTSEMIEADISNWKLWIVNHTETVDGGIYEGALDFEIELEGAILPGQTFLIVARSAANATTNLPSDLVLDVGLSVSETLLNPHGFELYLEANTQEADHNYHTPVDIANNLDLSAGRDQVSLAPLWNWPSGYDADGNRVSAVRTSDSNGPTADGESAAAWELHTMSDDQADLTYYGHKSDVSSPGYYPDLMVLSMDDAIVAAVSISEIMYASGDSNLSQWIELKNASETIEADLSNWKLWITNHSETADGGMYEGKLDFEIDLKGSIPPGQTFLIVADKGKDGTGIPSHRVLDVGVGASETLLNPHGFELYLEANTHQASHTYHIPVDVANNLDLSAGRDHVSLMPIWSWPKGYDADGNRVSVVRKSGVDGETAAAWELYNVSGQMGRIGDPTYYGHDSDVSGPGHYPGSALISSNDDVYTDVIISEIMYASGKSNLPQWIELKNRSQTVGADMRNWTLWVTNHSETADGGAYEGAIEHEIHLDGSLPPGQTFLIVARSGRNTTRLPSHRVHNVDLPHSEMLLNPHGFELYLEANTHETDHYYHKKVDVANNMDLSAGRAQISVMPILWSWPKGYDTAGNRVSVVRRPSVDGDSVDAWQLYNMSGQIKLSKFRPERLKDTGQVVVRWITESELNNAGFNILRSETRKGQFTKINAQIIAGQGTTSEQTLYEYVDKTAKPNVVYYYQIQDISLDGQVQTLQTSRLKGNVTAAGKLTATWGELKLRE